MAQTWESKAATEVVERRWQVPTGDTDGDGLPDLLVGGPRFEEGGRVWLVLGAGR